MYYTATIMSLNYLTSIIYITTGNGHEAPGQSLGNDADTHARDACEFLLKKNQNNSLI